MLHLDGECSAVPVEDRALDGVCVAFSRAVECDQLCQERPVALDEEPVKRLALDLVESEYPSTRSMKG